VDAHVLVLDGRFRCPSRHFADQDRSGFGGRLHPRRRVDQVARDHPLPGRSQRHGGIAGQNAHPRLELGCPQLGAERRDRLGQVQRGANGPFGVVLLCDRRSPHRHDGVADELLDGPAVAGDQPAAGIEVSRKEVADLFGVSALGEWREPDEVGEQD